MKLINYCTIAFLFFAFSHTCIAQQNAVNVQGNVELLDAGEAPRQMLRFKVKKGQTETAKMEMNMNMEMKEMGQKMDMPTMNMEMNIHVLDVLANGNIRYDFTMGKASIETSADYPPAMISQLEQSLAAVEGMGGEATVTDRGMTVEATFNFGQNVDAQAEQVMQNMEQTMNQISAPMPDEPVGEGAKWQYSINANQGGISIEQVVTYELVSIDGDELNIRATVKQSAPKQSMAATGNMVSLESLNSEGTGDIKLGLSKLVPVLSNMDIKSTMVMSTEQLAEQGTMTMSTGIKVKLTSE